MCGNQWATFSLPTSVPQPLHVCIHPWALGIQSDSDLAVLFDCMAIAQPVLFYKAL